MFRVLWVHFSNCLALSDPAFYQAISIGINPFEMSSSVLPAALKRRRMGLADGLDISSLFGYRTSLTRKELISSVGWSIVGGWSFRWQELPLSRPCPQTTNQMSETCLKLTFCKLVFPCKLAVAFSARYSIQTPPLIISGAIVCVGVLLPSPSCLAKTHITQSKFRLNLDNSKRVCWVWVTHKAIVDRGATQTDFSRHLPSAPPIMWLLTVRDQLF